MNVFVIGGAGFIGSHIVDALLKDQHTVTIYDNLSTGFKDLVPKEATLVEKDIRVLEDLKEAMRGHDSVIHLAAQAQVPRSIDNPRETFDINVSGGINVLEAMRLNTIKKLVYSSSAAVYGQAKIQPIVESAPLRPINPYGTSKLMLEQACRSYHDHFDLDVTALRYFNPYGPNDIHQPETHVIPNIIEALLESTSIPLYWDGQQKRDFFYVGDLAQAHLRALDQTGWHVYNIGSGHPRRVREVVDILFEVSGKKTTLEDLGRREGDPDELFADISKISRELDWQPTTSLHDGLQQTWKFYSGRSK